MTDILDHSQNKPFEIFLSTEQLKIAQSHLPKGFSLQFSNKPNRRDKPAKTKKRTFEDNAVPSNSSHSSNIKSRPTKKIKTNSPIDNSAYSYNTNLSTYNDISSNKRSSLRDKKYTNFEHKYADFENTQLGSGFNLFNNSIGASHLPKNISESLKKCYKILLALKKHHFSYPFLKPVDPVALQVPDYYEIVKDPMDLGTIEKNLRSGLIASPSQFITDIKKIWSNSYIYNSKGSDIYHMTQQLESYFNKLVSEMDPSKITHAANDNHISELHKKVERLTNKIKELHTKNPNVPNKNQKSSGIVSDKPMSLQEKRNLGQNIRNLPTQYLRGVWEIVNDGTLNQHKEELEFDIDTLPPRKCRELERYVNSKISLMRKNEVKDTKTKGKPVIDKKGIKRNDIEKPGYDEIDIPQIKNEKEAVKNMFAERNDYGRNVGLFQGGYEMKIDNNNYQSASNRMEEEKKMQINPISQNDISKSSDSSFITDSEDSLSEK